MDPSYRPPNSSKYQTPSHDKSSDPTVNIPVSIAWSDRAKPPGSDRPHHHRRPSDLNPLATSGSAVFHHSNEPRLCRSPVSENSEASLVNHVEHETPGQSPHHAGSPIRGTTASFARVSLEQAREQSSSPRSYRGRDMLSAPSSVAPKRSASSDVPGSAVHQNHVPHAPVAAGSQNRAPNFVPPKMQKRTPHGYPSYDRLEQFRVASIQSPQRRMMDHKTQVRPFVQSHNRPKKEAVMHRDSGYETAPSRNNTLIAPDGPRLHQGSTPTIQEQYQRDAMQHHKGVIQLPAHGRYPGLILQPDSSPISQEQLAAEVKGIYAGLVMVEAKCINIDAAQAADPKQPLGPEQWQALIALHRTLLYEHHDFLMATQHPSATPALRGLATKYSMPARMWKHGIHAFLEVLRHRRPESQDYMLAFIYLAYQMMALLFETVPAFTDTWIECLGDLARYRMAIEEEKEAHATWGGVAARWYTLASDRHPAIGRLYHHLGILERPSLRKFCLYAKSLTCVIPFANARDSLATLCGPIVQDELTVQSNTSTTSAEARAVTLHALVSSRSDIKLIKPVQSDVLELLREQPSKLRDFGAYLAIINIAGLFEMGLPTNPLFQQYTTAINQAMQQARPSMSMTNHPVHFSSALPYTPPSQHFQVSEDFWAGSFNTLMESYDPTCPKDCLPFVHVMLVNIHSLHSLRARLLNGQSMDTYRSPINTGRLAWGGLARVLNTLAQQEPITDRVLECARQGVFLAPERKEDAKPLSEDYLIRGLLWGQFYFSPGWFDGQSEDDGRAIETQSMQTARAQRVLWLGLYLAFHTEFIQYDVQKRWFSSWSSFVAHTPTTNTSLHAETIDTGDVKEQLSTTTNPGSRASLTVSSSPSSDEYDGFTLVKHPKNEKEHSKPRPQPTAAPTPIQSWAKVAAKAPAPTMKSRKHKQDFNTCQVADEDGMVWNADDDTYKPSIRSGYSFR